MANYRGYDKTARTWIGILAIFMVLVIALAVIFGVMTKGFTDWSRFESDKQEEQTQEEAENPNDSLLVSEGENNGFQLLSTPYMVTDAVSGETRAAGQTVSVENAINGVTYAWALLWSGSGDVADYVTLSATTGESVTVTCEQAFGNRITLTCRAMIEEQEMSSATCTIDYQKKLTGITLAGETIEDGETISFGDLSELGFREAMMTNGYTFEFDATFGTGTIDASVKDWSITVTASEYTDGPSTSSDSSIRLLSAMHCCTLVKNMSSIFAGGSYSDSEEAMYFQAVNLATYTFTITATSLGSVADEMEVSFDLTFPASMISGSYEIEMDQGSIVF